MICSKEKCTGCFACVNICPKNCIKMVEDDFGNIYPIINENECVQCNMCKTVCPSLQEMDFKDPIHAYAAWSNDELIRLKSTSGGIATILSKEVLLNDGIVYGAGWNRGILEHLRLTNIEELPKIQGSKYTHSYVKLQYKRVKQDLLNEKQVLFIGTPCQIAGLYSYLEKQYDNLYTIDIICHGVPSQKLLREELEKISDFDEVYFRDKDGFNLRVINDGKLLKTYPYYKSLYYQAFLDGITYRENCYLCNYAQPKRLSDITLGDFWGLGELETSTKEENKGISVVLINTEKGQELLDQIQSELFVEERPLKEAIDGNAQLQHPTKRSQKTDVFTDNYKKTKNMQQSLVRALNYNSIINKLKRFVLDSPFLMKVILKINK